MLSQNSVSRLLAAAGEVLNGDVAPRIEDDFARMQAKATAELLLNLADRVTWTEAELAQDVHDDGEVLAAALGGDGEAAGGGGGRHRDAVRAEAIEALKVLESQGASERLDAVEAVLRRQSADQAGAMTSTMYRAST
jgi:ribosomal protein S18 acetylase RimI-like enzyme